MQLAKLRALPIGTRLLAGLALEPVTFAGIEPARPGRRTDTARVLRWDGTELQLTARQLAPAPPAVHPDVVMVRPGLGGVTMTIERITVKVWSRIGSPRGSVGQLAVIERRDGRFHRVCCLASDIWGGGDLETAAKAYADECGGTYVLGGGQ